MAAPGLPRAAYLHIFDESVVVDDPIGVHTDESRAVMLQRLTALYALRCHRGCFIYSIENIIDIQAAEIGYESDLGHGQVRVQFSAHTLKYTDGDIIAGAEIISKTPDLMCATLAIGGVIRLFINIRTNRFTESIAVKQKVIVRLRRMAYPYGNDKIMANGELYMPIPVTRVYDCGTSDYTVTTEAESMIETLTTLQAELRVAPQWERYRDVLLPWKKVPDGPPAGAVSADLAKIAAKDGQLPRYIARDLRQLTDPSAARVYTYREPVFPGDYELIAGISPECVIIDLLREEIEYIKLLLDCSEIYNGPVYDSHKNMWTVIASGKV